MKIETRNDVSEILREDVKEEIKAEYMEYLKESFVEEFPDMDEDEIEEMARDEFNEDGAFEYWYNTTSINQVLESIDLEMTEELKKQIIAAVWYEGYELLRWKNYYR